MGGTLPASSGAGDFLLRLMAEHGSAGAARVLRAPRRAQCPQAPRSRSRPMRRGLTEESLPKPVRGGPVISLTARALELVHAPSLRGPGRSGRREYLMR